MIKKSLEKLEACLPFQGATLFWTYSPYYKIVLTLNVVMSLCKTTNFNFWMSSKNALLPIKHDFSEVFDFEGLGRSTIHNKAESLC